MKMGESMWGGRFTKAIDGDFARLNASFGFDWRLYEADIRGSVAYAEALVRAGVLTAAERESLISGLTLVRDEFRAGTFRSLPSDEDIHTAVERRLGELVGSVAGKLHTGRSRNDQVATDVRLFVLDSVAAVQRCLRDLQRALVEVAEQNAGVLMPGYTHLQRAQPLLFAHWLLSFFWMLQRDWARFAGCAERASVLPLGSGALAGNAFGVDRALLAERLGFRAVSENSVDAVSDRDFIVEYLFAAALTGVHLSRLGEDLVLYSTAEFDFVRLDDAYATGSSLMPQKKNPDSMELARGKAARLIGHVTALLTLLKGLPSSYDKDLQEDKEPLFDADETMRALIPVVAGVIRTLRVNPARMHAALDDAMLATDLADHLVRKGTAFREAHRKAGEAVQYAEARGIRLAQLETADFLRIAPECGAEVMEVFDFARSIAAREIAGGTGPESVREQIRQACRILNS
jgi:argininosuccinate lyase